MRVFAYTVCMYAVHIHLMYVYMCIKDMYVYTYINAYICIHVYAYVYTCMCVQFSPYTCVCMPFGMLTAINSYTQGNTFADTFFYHNVSFSQVPNLMQNEDMERIMSSVAPKVKALGKPETRETF